MSKSSHKLRDNCYFDWLKNNKENRPKQEVKEVLSKDIDELEDSDILLIKK